MYVCTSKGVYIASALRLGDTSRRSFCLLRFDTNKVNRDTAVCNFMFRAQMVFDGQTGNYAYTYLRPNATKHQSHNLHRRHR